jgi:hypothetical protein
LSFPGCQLPRLSAWDSLVGCRLGCWSGCETSGGRMGKMDGRVPIVSGRRGGWGAPDYLERQKSRR